MKKQRKWVKLIKGKSRSDRQKKKKERKREKDKIFRMKKQIKRKRL